MQLFQREIVRIIPSPLNYTGGKYKLLPQVLPLFPKDIRLFADLFCGGCNVGINVESGKVLYNDIDMNLICMYNTFKNLDKRELLTTDCSLEEICTALVFDGQSIISGINAELGTNVTTMSDAYKVVESNRYQRLQRLIEVRFTQEKILKLLDLFENRQDEEIKQMVTDNADTPTIFEYVLGILWYKVSERKDKILDYMKLSLDADLLPKSHAAGGEADIVYEYGKTAYFPAHTLLFEATLSEGTNQRRMEMEPVSRHLGQHLIRTGNRASYCLFATNYLHINVIADFRSRKNTPYYDPADYNNHVDSMKIIPVETKELKTIVAKEIKYKELYKLFASAYESELLPHEWYDASIKNLSKTYISSDWQKRAYAIILNGVKLLLKEKMVCIPCPQVLSLW